MIYQVLENYMELKDVGRNAVFTMIAEPYGNDFHKRDKNLMNNTERVRS